MQTHRQYSAWCLWELQVARNTECHFVESLRICHEPGDLEWGSRYVGSDQVESIGGSWGELQATVIRAKPCSGFSCRWLAQNGEWAFPLVTGLLCVLTIFSLVSLNFSDPGILHQGEMLAPRRRK